MAGVGYDVGKHGWVMILVNSTSCVGGFWEMDAPKGTRTEGS